MALPICLQEDYYLEVDQAWHPHVNRKTREKERIEFLKLLGYFCEEAEPPTPPPERTEIQKFFDLFDDEKKPEITEKSPYRYLFKDQSDYRVKVFNEFDNLQDLGWFHFIYHDSPWSEDSHPIKKLIKYENLELTGPELIGHLSPMIVATGLSNLNKVPLSDVFALTKLQLSNKNLTDIESLKRYCFLQYVDISHNVVEDITPLKHTLHLMVLDASNNRISSFSIKPPPWFLTYLNLSFNKFTEIPDLTPFWSLKHLNLAYNFITKIEGLINFQYLRYLNLSHNHIELIENVSSPSLIEIDLSHNLIHGEAKYGGDDQVNPFSSIITLEFINLSHNRLQRLNFIGTTRLSKLDISHNELSSILAIDDISKMVKLSELVCYGNEIMNIPDIIRHLVYILPNLNYLNNEPIGELEKVDAFFMYGNNLFTNAVKSYTYSLLYNHVEPATIGEETVQKVSLHGILALVGPPGNGVEIIITEVVRKYGNYVRQMKLHSTLNIELTSESVESLLLDEEETKYETNEDDEDSINDFYIHVSETEFNQMLTDGKFIFIFHSFGNSFGLSCEQLIDDGKVPLIGVSLKEALELRWNNLEPTCILAMPENETLHKNRIKKAKDFYMKGSHERSPSEYYEDEGELEEIKSNTDLSYHLDKKSSASSSHTQKSHQVEITEEEKAEEEEKKISISEKNIRSSVDEGMCCHSAIGAQSQGAFTFANIWWMNSEEIKDLYTTDKLLVPLRTYVEKVKDETVDEILFSRIQYFSAHRNSFFSGAISTDDIDAAVTKVGRLANEIYNTMKINKTIDGDETALYGNLYDTLVTPALNEMIEVLKCNPKLEFMDPGEKFEEPLSSIGKSMSSLYFSSVEDMLKCSASRNTIDANK